MSTRHTKMQSGGRMGSGLLAFPFGEASHDFGLLVKIDYLRPKAFFWSYPHMGISG